MTAKQALTLKTLLDYPRTAAMVANLLGIRQDTAGHRLRGLEERGLVRRTYPAGTAAVWELTANGRALAR